MELDQVHQNGVYQAKTTTGITINDCKCLFRKSMLLPCRHILALQKMLGMSQFDQELCDVRWTSSYYEENQQIFLETSPFTVLEKW